MPFKKRTKSTEKKQNKTHTHKGKSGVHFCCLLHKLRTPGDQWTLFLQCKRHKYDVNLTQLHTQTQITFIENV